MIAASEETTGRGVRNNLLQKVCETAKEREMRCVTMHVPVILKNPDGKRLYNSDGFMDEKKLRLNCCLPRVLLVVSEENPCVADRLTRVLHSVRVPPPCGGPGRQPGSSAVQSHPASSTASRRCNS